MTTKTYCDLCGNTVRNPRVYCFGPMPPVYHHGVSQAAQMPGQWGGGGPVFAGGTQNPVYSGVTSVAHASPSIKQIDLCQHCEKTWMERVEKITGLSEPEIETA